MIELNNILKTYRQGPRMVEALRGVSLTIAAGEFACIMGPSGSGKSTLMHILGALDVPSSGRALFRGTDLNAISDAERSHLRRQRIGFVFQAFNLVPALNATENVALPLILGGARRGEANARAMAALERVGLAARAGHYPDELSGGEMQRAAIARALVNEPDVVLCDEPTGNLDSANGRTVLELLADLPRGGERAVVMVTHDANAARFGNRTIKLRDGQIESDEPSRTPGV